jgi:ribonuclease P protein component
VDYRRILRRGLRLDGPLFCLVVLANRYGHDRLGLAASRRLGGAVERNRAKRLLREVFRCNKRQGAEGVDLVFLPKREITTRSQAEVEREYRQRLRRLASRRLSGSTPPAPHD